MTKRTLRDIANVGVNSAEFLSPRCQIEDCPNAQEVELTLDSGQGTFLVCVSCATTLQKTALPWFDLSDE